MKNYISIEMDAKSENEFFGRLAVAGILTYADPTMEELTDVKTAVSEAVTNSIIHGYENKEGKILMKMALNDNELEVEITDYGTGIEDVKKAMEPMYTTKPDMERSGMGFSFMEAFMDELKVYSKKGEGTRVVMKKIFQD